MSSKHLKSIGQTPENRPKRAEGMPLPPEAQKVSLATYVRAIICLAAIGGCTQEPKGCVDVPQLVKDSFKGMVGEEGIKKCEKLHDKSGDFYACYPIGDANHSVMHFHGFEGEGPGLLDDIKSFIFKKPKKCKGKWTLDEFLKDGNLEGKFRESNFNAVFSAVDTPNCNYEIGRRRPNLSSMNKMAREKGGIKSEDIDWTLTAHSGGGYTARLNLKNPKVRNFVSLDTIYAGSTADLENWLKNERNRLILVATKTQSGSIERTKKLADKFGATPYSEIPSDPSIGQCMAKVTYIESPETHGNTKKLIPSALRMIKHCRWHGTRNK